MALRYLKSFPMQALIIIQDTDAQREFLKIFHFLDIFKNKNKCGIPK